MMSNPLFCVSKGCSLKDEETLEITRYLGESVLLPCSCADLQAKPQGNRWFRNINEHIYPPIPTRYSDRMYMLNQESPGNISLFISNLTAKDDGSYRCEGYTSSYRDITLRVKGRTIIAR